MEPCAERLDLEKSCVERILVLKGALKTVYVGTKEPVVADNDSKEKLEAEGIRWVLVEGMEKACVDVASTRKTKGL
jgi:hypothetical protein